MPEQPGETKKIGFARWYYRGRHFPFYQIVWPSNDGQYPWGQKASAYFKAWQPVLGKASVAD